MIPATGWVDCPEILETDVMANISPDSRRHIYRFDHLGFTWKSIELVHRAYGDKTIMTCVLSHSGSVALYEQWSKIEGINLDIAGAWAIALGGVIFYYTKDGNKETAKSLEPLLVDFPFPVVPLITETYKNASPEQMELLFQMVNNHIDPHLFFELTGERTLN